MAKGNAQRARSQRRTAAAPPPPPPRPSTLRTRQFWLGVLAAAALLIPLGVIGVVLAGNGDAPAVPAQPATASPTTDPAVAAETERLKKVSQTRDKEQVQELTDRTRSFSDELDPVVRGLAKTLPPENPRKVGPLADRSDVADWRRRTRRAAAYFEDVPSGDTGTNVARGALATAVRGLEEAVETYKLALDEPASRAAVLKRARAQRDIAMRAWETASTQIDVINVAVGFGHQHPGVPGGAGNAPDELPEGTDATEGG